MAGAVAIGALGVTALRPLQAPTQPPFRVPFAGPPSLHTWYLLQPYGNTTFAYRMRRVFYSAGQGLHFGIDFAAPCGTPVLAIGDGVVRVVDGSHGSWPHHIVIDHPQGVSSLYGHLLERPALRRGDPVQAGDLLGISGDSATLRCNGSPELHLELRYDEMRIATNPIHWIDADWPALTLGLADGGFQIDLDAPTRWQSMYDQPDVRFWHPMLNDYERTWPPA